MKGSERRRHPRIRRRIEVMASVTGARKAAPQPAVILNVSQSGAVLAPQRAIAVGTMLSITIPGSALGDERTLQAKVVWARTVIGQGERLGCEFLGEGLDLGKRAKEGRMNGGGGAATAVAEPTQQERRRAQRWNQSLALKLRCVTPGPFEESRWRPATLVDISNGGVEIELSREYVRDLVLELEFPESPLGREKKFHARVVWTGGSGKPGCFRLGCAFVKEMK